MKLRIPKDKLLHFLAGFGIQFLLGFIPIPLIDLYAFIIVIISAASKEVIWDKWMKKGVFDKEDFFATVLGGIVFLLTREIIGALFYFIINK